MRFGPVLSVFCLSVLSGCYTQLSTLDNYQPAPEMETVVDSTGDSVKVIKQIDTVETRERQTCVWERDLLGYPKLRCYTSNYPRNWLFYNNSPWWYRNDPYWYDYRQCPRYYYYDSDCGCCRYYTGRRGYYSSGGGRSYNSDSDITPGAPPRSRNAGTPSGTITETGKTPLPKEGSGTTSTENELPKPRRSRNAGYPSSNENSGGIPKESAIEPEKNKASSVPKEVIYEKQQETSPRDAGSDASDQTPRRKRVRSW